MAVLVDVGTVLSSPYLLPTRSYYPHNSRLGSCAGIQSRPAGPPLHFSFPAERIIHWPGRMVQTTTASDGCPWSDQYISVSANISPEHNIMGMSSS